MVIFQPPTTYQSSSSHPPDIKRTTLPSLTAVEFSPHGNMAPPTFRVDPYVASLDGRIEKVVHDRVLVLVGLKDLKRHAILTHKLTVILRHHFV